MSELIVVEKVNPIEVFTGGGLDPLLQQIKDEVSSFEPNLETAKGRKEIASMAYKVSQSKTVIDKLGKDLVTDWKKKSKQVDDARKTARDFLDSLRDEVRKPLTEWEEAEAERIAAEKLKKKIEEAHEQAIAENELFDRQREVERKEAELARHEEERKAKEEQERQERERLEREERLKREAAEQAKREAEEKVREAQEAKERAECERIAAEERAKIEKQQAIEAEQRKAKEEAERVERDRLEKERREREEAEKKAANKRHQAKINREAKESFIASGMSESAAYDTVVMIAQGKIKNVTINY